MKRTTRQLIAEAAQAGKPIRKRAKSRYAAKAAYLRTHGGWGWEYGTEAAESKPWRGKQ